MAHEPASAPPGDSAPGRGTLVAAGLALFLFIPLVLFLFVAHPAPVGLSLAAGVVLMLGHRFLARPYMRRALAAKCLWCNRMLLPPASAIAPGESLEIRAGGEVATARFCAGHRAPTLRFLSFLEAWAWPIRAGIFLPLLLLLGALTAAALGRAVPLATATDLFRLIVGVTVNVAAWGYLARGTGEDDRPVRVPFPLHNFTLLGIRTLLWIFRLVGIWWIVLALLHLLGR
ncbi:MAG TPA: hypothetical protein VIH93_02500 [Thermoanaerobaculia bacterium]|jgi:hypothetical protein